MRPTGSFPGKNELPARIDTGYDGFFLISEVLYNKLKLRLSEMPRGLGYGEVGDRRALCPEESFSDCPSAKGKTQCRRIRGDLQG